jgi:serine/threonine-protein kinase
MNDPASTKLKRTVAVSSESELDTLEEFDEEELHDSTLAGVERYRIMELIGEGGMGVVFRARDIDFDRDIALKILLKTHVGNQEMHRRFFDEAQITGQLEHPGIVPVYEMGSSEQGRPYFAMKMVEGQTLADLLENYSGSPLEQYRMLNIFARACQAIAFAHSRGYIHLDLKPSNVMVGNYGEVHVMDWGLSRRIDDLSAGVGPEVSEALNQKPDTSGKITGTPAYMPPEQARGRSIGLHSDVFGLGAVLCELLTRKPPFIGKNVRQIYRRAVNASLRRTFERLDACNADPSMIALAKRCLSSNPADRPSDAGIISTEITTYLASSKERAERDLCRFFDVSKDLFCIASLDGYFKRMNSDFARVLGYSDSELVSRPFVDFVHPDDVESTSAAVKTLAEGKQVAKFRNRYRNSAGEYVWFEWTARPFPEENFVFAVAQEITEQIKRDEDDQEPL